jgi:phage-related protein
VLHVFKKKSTKGKKTPKPDIDLIKSRLKEAQRKYAERNPKEKTD